MSTVMANTTKNMDRPCVQFLRRTATMLNALAEAEGSGRVEWDFVRPTPYTTYLEVEFKDEDEVYSRFKLFAAGQFRDRSMVKICKDGGIEHFVSAEPEVLLSIISDPD